jgi:hypothetical protein
MAEQPQTAPILTVTWDTVIGARPLSGGSYEEPPEYEPVNLGDAVVAQIVERLIGEIRKDIRKTVLAAVQPAVEAEVGAIVRETLTGQIRRRNRWGEVEGDPTTLRDMLADDVANYLNEPAKHWSSDERKGGFRQLLRAVVDETLSRELRKEVETAKAAVRAQVAAKAAEVFGDVVKQATR